MSNVFRIQPAREVPPPHAGPRDECPYCSCPLTAPLRKYVDVHTGKVVQPEGSTYVVIDGRSGQPVACWPTRRVRTGSWWGQRCEEPGRHIHQECPTCRGAWTCGMHDPRE